MERKIKILYVVSTLKRCGPTNQLYNIISNLDSQRFTGMIITLSAEANDSLKPRFVNAGIGVESLDLGRLAGIVGGYAKLKKLLKKYDPHIIHTQGIRADYYAAKLREQGRTTISTLRCVPHEDYVMTYGKVLGELMSKAHINYLRRVNLTVAVSRSIHTALRHVGLNTEVIQNGCDLGKYQPASQAEKAELRKNLNLPNNKLILVSVGHLSSRKDPLTIIRAFKNSTAVKWAQLIFIGDGDLRKECELASGKEDAIQFTGRVSNVEDYLKASDIFVSASLSEGLPNTVLESLACGVPTILSQIPQHEEVFESVSEKHPSFAVKDVDGLANILNHISKDDLDTLPTRELVEANFDAIKMSGQYQSFYQGFILQ